MVLGDIIHLETGDKVPADCRLINCVELQVDESVLTGESEPVYKQSTPLPTSVGILPPDGFKLLLISGVFGAVIGLGLFHFSGGNSSHSSSINQAQTLIFNYVVLYEMIPVFIIIKNYKVPLFTNCWLWTAVLFSILMQGVLMYTPLRNIFHITPLDYNSLLQLFIATRMFSCMCFLFTHVLQQKGSKL